MLPHFCNGSRASLVKARSFVQGRFGASPSPSEPLPSSFPNKSVRVSSLVDLTPTGLSLDFHSPRPNDLVTPCSCYFSSFPRSNNTHNKWMASSIIYFHSSRHDWRHSLSCIKCAIVTTAKELNRTSTTSMKTFRRLLWLRQSQHPPYRIITARTL